MGTPFGPAALTAPRPPSPAPGTQGTAGHVGRVDTTPQAPSPFDPFAAVFGQSGPPPAGPNFQPTPTSNPQLFGVGTAGFGIGAANIPPPPGPPPVTATTGSGNQVDITDAGHGNWQPTNAPGSGGSGAQPAPYIPKGDWDLSKAGIGERVGAQAATQLMNPSTLGREWAMQNGNAFKEPGQGEQYWNQVSGNFNSRPVATNRAETAYNSFQNQRNELGELPGLDPYYDRARDRTAADMNRQLAARGGYNTSRGINVVSDAMQGLSAEQANREADYALRRSQNALNWASGGSQAAQGADASSRGVAQTDLAQTLGYGSLANQAQGLEQGRQLTDLGVAMGLDSQEMARLSGATQAASTSQMAREGRIGQVFDSAHGLGNSVSNTVGQNHQQMFAELNALEDAIHAAALAGDKAALDRATARRAEIMAGAGAAAELGGKVLPMLGGM